MKTWILGIEYDLADAKSLKTLMDNIGTCHGVNSLRQISLALVIAIANLQAEVKKSSGEVPTKYYSLNCVDNADGQGFSVFLAYKHTSPNVPSNRLLVKEAIAQGILDAIHEDDINKVEEISKEDYDHAMSL